MIRSKHFWKNNKWLTSVLLCVAGMGSLCPTPEEEPLPSLERWKLPSVLANSCQFRAQQPVSTSTSYLPVSITPYYSTFVVNGGNHYFFSSLSFFLSLHLRLLTFGSAVEVTGVLRESPHQKQQVELEAEQIHVVGECNPVVRLG